MDTTTFVRHLRRHGFFAVRQLMTGEWVGVKRQSYGSPSGWLYVGLTLTAGWRAKYHYDSVSEALAVANNWEGWSVLPPGNWSHSRKPDGTEWVNPQYQWTSEIYRTG